MDILDEGIKTIPEADEIEIGRIEHEAEIGLSHIKNARIAFAVLAGFSVLSIFLSMARNPETPTIYIFVEGMFMCAGYLTALFLIPKYPRNAIVGGLSFYLFIILINALVNPVTIFSGWLMKAAVIYYLVKSVKGASEFTQANEVLKLYGREKTITW